MATPAINYDEIKAKVSQMTPEERTKKLEEFRTRQLFQQKKQAAKGGQALYNKRRMEEIKLMREMAKADGSLEEIDARAKEAAQTKFDEYLDKELGEQETTETETE